MFYKVLNMPLLMGSFYIWWLCIFTVNAKVRGQAMLNKWKNAIAEWINLVIKSAEIKGV